MSVNKYALTRYQILDKCFGNPGKKFFIQDLLQAVNSKLTEVHPETNGIKVRQLYDDIAYMQSSEGYNAPIERYLAGKQKFLRYSVANYSINNQPLNESEIDQIKSALDIISRFKGMPQFEWVNELAPKLEQAFTIDKSIKPIIGFEQNEFLKGINFISDLFHAILYKKVICIHYQSFNGKKIQQFTIHPYYLKQYNNRWFVFGANKNSAELMNLALDRIEFIEDKNQTYIENTIYDFDELFDDIIGVSKYNSSSTDIIILKVTESAAPYILSKPLHGSQKIKERNPALIISIEVKPNKELEALLLSFGERIEVLSPQSLRETLIRRLSSSLKVYSITNN